jgi:putative lipoic acid-binding regulatory protein
MAEQEPPKIEFPCDYPIKVLCRSGDDLTEVIVETFERHAPGFDRESISFKSSSKGTFTSLTITITATGPDQLEALHQELLSTGRVHMVI